MFGVDSVKIIFCGIMTTESKNCDVFMSGAPENSNNIQDTKEDK